jgi:hypothetical protein
MRDEEETQQNDDVADVSAAGEAASATPGATLGHDPDPDLIEAANAAEKSPDKE